MKYFWWPTPDPFTSDRRLMSIDLTVPTGCVSPQTHWQDFDMVLKGLIENGYTEISYMTAYQFGWPT